LSFEFFFSYRRIIYEKRLATQIAASDTVIAILAIITGIEIIGIMTREAPITVGYSCTF
jgi:hypothetical protein